MLLLQACPTIIYLFPLLPSPPKPYESQALGVQQGQVWSRRGVAPAGNKPTIGSTKS